MPFFKKAILISICLMLLLGFPQRSYAFLGIGDVVLDPANLVQNTIGAINTTKGIVKTFADIALRAVARHIIQRLTASTVNWINSGFKGNPAYVRDPGQFFLNIGDQTASSLLSQGALANLCSPFSAKVRVALVKNYLAETDNKPYSCTLGKLAQTYNQFTNDFSQGGWDAWFQVTQNIQNNPYGEYLQTSQAISAQVGNEKEKAKAELTTNKGFLSLQKCERGEDVVYSSEFTAQNEEITNKGFESCVASGKDPEECNTAYPPSPKAAQSCKTVTPGSVIESQLETSLGSGVRQLELAKNFDEVISALVVQLYEKAVGGVGGLFGAGKDNSPTDKTPDHGFDNLISNGPKITLNGPSHIDWQAGRDYVDEGAIAFDFTDGDITSSMVTDGLPDTSTPGVYTITYTVKNSKGVAADPVTRTVKVGGTDSGTASTTPSGTPKVPIILNHTDLTFSAEQGGSPAETGSIGLVNSTTTALSWSAELSKDSVTTSKTGPVQWVVLSAMSGSVEIKSTLQVRVSVSSNTLPKGTYHAKITVSVTNPKTEEEFLNEELPVTLTIN